MVKILVVEDEQDWQDTICNSIRTALASSGYQEPIIGVAGNYERAASALYDGWDLLVADITLNPNIESSVEGRIAGNELIARASTLQLPTVVVSGTTTDWEIQNYLFRLGVKDCFQKNLFTPLEREFQNCVLTILQEQENLPDSHQNTLIRPKFDVLPQSWRGYSLIIGIDQYAHIKPLKKAKIDAKSIYRTLIRTGYLEENMQLLLDGKATKNDISNGLDWLARCATADDTVIIFFAGHGVRRIGGFNPGSYLCPVEADLRDLNGTGISDNELSAALQHIQAERLVVFLDACHSGGVGEMRKTQYQIESGLSLSEEMYERLLQDGGRALVASCKPNEVSWELDGMPNGLFTHYLLEGLRGEAACLGGGVPIFRLCDYVSYNVSLRASQQSEPQTPVLRFSGENFLIVPARYSRHTY